MGGFCLRRGDKSEMELDGDTLLDGFRGIKLAGYGGEEHDGDFELDCDAFMLESNNQKIPEAVAKTPSPVRPDDTDEEESEDEGVLVSRLTPLSSPSPTSHNPVSPSPASRPVINKPAFASSPPKKPIKLEDAISPGKYKDKYTGKLDKKSFLGKGKFSQVYLCTRKKSQGQQYAVKVIDKKGLTKKQLEEIKKEAAICQLLDNEYVMKIYDYYNEKKKNSLVFEIINGGELFDYIIAQDDGISEQQSSTWFKQLLQALDYCHNKGVMHRDVKLENLMLTGENSVTPNSIKLVDFGLASLVPERRQALGVVGSANYMAPEVAKNEPYSKDIDLWSSGVVLYILLSGTMPFLGNDQAETLEIVKRGKFSFPNEDFGGVTSNAKELVSLLMMYNPEERLLLKDALAHAWMGDAPTIKRRGSVMSLRKSKSTRRSSIRRSSIDSFGDDSPSKPGRITEVTGIVHDTPLGLCRDCVKASSPGSYLVKVAAKTSKFIVLVQTAHKMFELEAKVEGDGEIIFHGMAFAEINGLVRSFNRLKISDNKGGTLKIVDSAPLWLTTASPEKCKNDVQFAGPGRFLIHKTSKGTFLSINDNGTGVQVEKLKHSTKTGFQFKGKNYSSVHDLASALVRSPFTGSISGRPVIATQSPYAED